MSPCLAALPLAGCAILEDNGTHLAFALERASRQLLASAKEELVIAYEPMTGIDQRYEVRMTASRNPQAPYGGSVVVTGRNGGGTTYQSHHMPSRPRLPGTILLQRCKHKRRALLFA